MATVYGITFLTLATVPAGIGFAVVFVAGREETSANGSTLALMASLLPITTRLPFKASPSRAPTRTVSQTTPFDYTAALGNDLTLQGLLAQITGAGFRQQGALSGGIGQLYGRLGEAPDLAAIPEAWRASLQKALTPDVLNTIAFGNKAGTTRLARLQQLFHGAQGATGAGLAARGMLRSGAYGLRQNANLRNLQQGQYDERLAAADTLAGLQNTFLAGQDDLRGQQLDATAAAQGRIGQQIGAGLINPTTTTRTVTNPYLNPAAPGQVSTGVTSGSQTSYEPKPTAGNIIPRSTPRPAAPSLSGRYRYKPGI